MTQKPKTNDEAGTSGDMDSSTKTKESEDNKPDEVKHEVTEYTQDFYIDQISTNK